MKRILIAIACLLLLVLHGQDILSQWNFNDTNNVASPAPAVGRGTAALRGGVTGSLASGTGSSDPVTAGDEAWNLSGFPAQGESPRAAGAQFAISTVGFEHIRLCFDWRASNTASQRLAVLYTTDGAGFLEVTNFTLHAGGTFTNGLTADFGDLPGVRNNPNFAVQLVSDFADGSQYLAAQPGSGYGTTGTWRLDMVTVLGTAIAGAEAPQILTQPKAQTVTTGGDASFTVLVTGVPWPDFQWQHDQTNLVNATNATLRLKTVTATDAGDYRVLVSNAVDQVFSDTATLTVTPNGGPVVTNIAYLRSLVDPLTFLPTDTNSLFTAEGVVTTWTNLATAANTEFFLQDDTAGIAVFVAGGGAANCLPAGTRVRVTGPLGDNDGLLQLNLDAGNPAHALVMLSANNPLPAPRPLDFNWPSDPAVIEPVEGSYVVAANVFLDRTSPVFKTGGDTLAVTNAAGETFTLRVDVRTDIGGQLKPAGPVTIYGVLAQSSTAILPTGGYQLMPTRFADIVSDAKAPTVRFTNLLSNLLRPGDAPTNTFTEQVLRPGEKLTINLAISDPNGKVVTVQPVTNGLPATAQWNFSAVTGSELAGTFTAQPTADEAGGLFTITVLAWNDTVTNTANWSLYVPTGDEQQMIITEYLANPASAASSSFFNPLNRAEPAPSPGQNDEYVEVVNDGAATVELQGWMLFDSASATPRLRVYDSTPLTSSNAVIFYGGPATGFEPQLEVPCVPAQESSAELALNNDGDAILLRNAASNLVVRVVYTSGMVSAGGSMTRYPDVNGPFVPQANVSADVVSPGRQYDGKLWSEPSTLPPVDVGEIAVTLNADASVTLRWAAQSGRNYSVLTARDIAGPYTALGSGLKAGQFTDNTLHGVGARFYRVSSP